MDTSSSVGGGSFVLGFLGGLVGGVFLLLFVLRKAKPATRMGYWFGAALQLLFFLAQHFATSGSSPVVPGLG